MSFEKIIVEILTTSQLVIRVNINNQNLSCWIFFQTTDMTTHFIL